MKSKTKITNLGKHNQVLNSDPEVGYDGEGSGRNKNREQKLGPPNTGSWGLGRTAREKK